MDLIIHHAHCPDGWAAAYIASHKFPEAELMALDHGIDPEPVIKACEGKDVLMVDYSLRTRELNDRLNSVAKSFLILDHHKTAQAVLEGADYAIFDMNRSGAGLTWDYLFGYEQFKESNWSKYDKGLLPNIMVPMPRPWWVDYVETQDLWKWERFVDSREVCAYITTLNFTKEDWGKLEKMKVSEVGLLGIGCLRQINHYVHEAVQQAQTGELLGYKTAVLNVPYLMCSQVGNELAKTHEVSLTWFERKDSIIQFSLRSIGDIDVSAIAKQFNGGGHKNAAGFQLPLLTGRHLVDDILGRPHDGFFEKFNDIRRSPGGCAK